MEQIIKPITSISDIRKEIEYLDKCFINTFSGFWSNKEIKVNITSNKKIRYIISYHFKSKYLYKEFNRYLKQKKLMNLSIYTTITLHQNVE